MVFQSYALYPHMSVRDNLAFGLKMARTPEAEIETRVRAASAILKIDALLDRRPGQLSGGQRQRVAIGRAIVRKPDVFLLDEPLSNLDAELRVSMRIEIARLHRERRNTMIYVTHDQTEAMTLADMIVVLRDGRIEQPGTPREVYENPTNIFVAGFIGSPRMNLLAARWEKDGLMYLGKNRIPMPRQSAMPSSGTDITLGIRPEHLVVSTSSEGFLETKVDFTEYLGVTQFLYCQTHEGQAIIAEHRSPAPVSSGDTIHFSWNSAHLRFFDAAGLRVRGNPEGKLTKFQQEDCLFLHLH